MSSGSLKVITSIIMSKVFISSEIELSLTLSESAFFSSNRLVRLTSWPLLLLKSRFKSLQTNLPGKQTVRHINRSE